MPNEIIGVQVEVGGNVEKSVGSMRQQLRAAITDLQNMQQEFGDISPQAIQAARAVAQLRDGIRDAQEVAELFNPEKTFQAVVNVASGIASGFAAAQGAMALFGVQSEAVEKTLLKVQAAMALAQGLAGIRAATEDFLRLAGVVRNLSIVQGLYNFVMNGTTTATVAATVATTGWTVALRILRGALLSTGIGAIVVLIGTAIAQIIELTEATDDYTEALDKNEKETRDFANATSDLIVARYQKETELAVARAKAEGKSAKEIYDIQKEGLDKIARERNANWENQKNDRLDASDAHKKAEEADTEVTLAELNERARARDLANRNAEEASRKAEAAAKERKKKADEENKKFEESDKELGENSVKAAKAMIQQTQQAEAEKAAAEKAATKERIDNAIAAQDAQFQVEKEYSDKRKQIADAEKNHKLAAAQAVSTGLQAFAALAGEQTVAGKALSIAAATISTYASAQAAYQSAFMPVPTYISPILGALAAGAAVVSGLANIKRIVQVQIPGKGGAGGSVPSMSTFGAPPLTPQAQQTATVQLNQQSVNSIGNAIPARAYVVEADITESQKRANRIQEAAKFR